LSAVEVVVVEEGCLSGEHVSKLGLVKKESWIVGWGRRLLVVGALFI